MRRSRRIEVTFEPTHRSAEQLKLAYAIVVPPSRREVRSEVDALARRQPTEVPGARGKGGKAA